MDQKWVDIWVQINPFNQANSLPMDREASHVNIIPTTWIAQLPHIHKINLNANTCDSACVGECGWGAAMGRSGELSKRACVMD